MMADYSINKSGLEDVYSCQSEVVWTVESYSLLLIRRDTGAQLTLGYPEAALWDLLSRKTPLEKIIQMLAAIAGTGPYATRQLIAKIISKWEEEGWLSRSNVYG